MLKLGVIGSSEANENEDQRAINESVTVENEFYARYTVTYCR
jgi:hypothetical protein